MDEQEKSRLRHDLRGCLNSIALSVEVLKLTGQSGESSRFIGCIETQVAQMEQLVKQLDRKPAAPAAMPPVVSCQPAA